MTLRRCARGHHFDDGRGPACPPCAVLGIVRTTEALTTGAAAAGATPSALAVDPVVGWLVCIAGADRGRDFRLRSARTTIGRGLQMDVCIQGDPAVSRDTHAIVHFDTATAAFALQPGSGRRPVWVNGEDLVASATLAAWDVVTLGDTHLLFVPLCGARFGWSAVAGG
ncbi:MAG TPA: FHA domain-containing protein [Candidatus Binatia bacterium]|jgi:hypothetical protein|nr:FHA domain-containing protein [Candidatus Binatia bacterium]